MKTQKDTFLVKMSSFFYRNWRYSLLLWLFLLVFGALSYTRLIQREGFPPIQFPLTVVNGTYFVENPQKVDADVLQPISDKLAAVDGVSSVQATAGPSFFSTIVFFEGDVSPEEGTKSVQAAIGELSLPSQVKVDYLTVDPAGFLNKYDLLLSVYSKEETTPEERDRVAAYVASELSQDEELTLVEPIPLVATGVNPENGEEISRQISFGRIGINEDSQLNYYEAATIGIDRDAEKLDIIELSAHINEEISSLDLSQFSGDFGVAIGGEFASAIENQIASLEENLIGGLLAVAIVSCLFITWRASLITGLLMVTVLAVTVGIMYIVGYTLNTITLFALVLALGLFVDDSTIVVEAITANRKKGKKGIDVIRDAIRMIGKASFAGSATTILAFLPLAFVSGILGEFIRLLPITVVISLVASILLSLTIIPFLSRFIILRSNVSTDWFTAHNPVSKVVDLMSKVVGALPRLLITHRKKGILVATFMVFLSFASVMAAGYYASKISFNIFPPTKDSDQIGYEISFPPNYTVQQAEASSKQVDEIVKREIGNYVTHAVYGANAVSSERGASVRVELQSFTEREPKSPELIQKVQAALESELPEGISARVIQYDAGPPVAEFPLKVQVTDEDTERGLRLSAEIEAYINGATITRQNGTTAVINRTKSANPLTVVRIDGNRTFEVQGAFSADDTSALLIASENFIKEKFTPEYLQSQGYPSDAIGFDFGQESENAESFTSLIYVFPIVLLAMYILLAAQFKSFLQPLLIFLAIPFGFMGVFAGLYYTDNALSFFVQVGLLGLIGIAVNNSILLTDYANQERRKGANSVEAIASASTKRFRPLITTTLTTVAALVPLALLDPFWEPLAFTIIFGLMSSTLLIILAFPYYYLVSEKLRVLPGRFIRRIRRH